MANTTIRLLASGAAISNGDLFITRQGVDTVDKSVTGTQLRAFAAPSIGGTITGGTDGSVLFVHPAGILAQDTANFYRNTTDATNRYGLKIGPVSGGSNYNFNIFSGPDPSTFNGDTSGYFSANTFANQTANGAGASFISELNSSSGETAYGTYFLGTGIGTNQGPMYGSYAAAAYGGSGTATDIIASYAGTYNYGSGVVTRAYSFFGANPANIGAGSIANAFGIYQEPVTSGATANWNIYSGNPTADFDAAGADLTVLESSNTFATLNPSNTYRSGFTAYTQSNATDYASGNLLYTHGTAANVSGYIEGVQFLSSWRGSGTANQLTGGLFFSGNSGPGVVTNLVGAEAGSNGNYGGGSVVNNIGFRIADQSNVGTNNYGLKIADFSASGSNYPIYTGTGKIRFGDSVLLQRTALGATLTDTSGLYLENTTAAAAGAQQVSPAVTWAGQGWKTTATAASQTVEFSSYVLPVQGAANPTGLWNLASSINGAAYSTALTVTSGGNVGISQSSPTARLHLPAGTATADTAPLKFTSGTLNTVAVAGQHEYNGNHRLTNDTIRFGVGGTLFDYFTDTTVGGAEADIYTSTTAASTLNANGDKILATYGGNFVTVGTELTQLKVYFGGTAIWDSTGLAPATGTTSWNVDVKIIRVSSTVVRYSVTLNTTGASGFVYAVSGELTGLTLSNTNILKITGTSTGVGSGSGDIVGKMGYVEFKPAA